MCLKVLFTRSCSSPAADTGCEYEASAQTCGTDEWHCSRPGRGKTLAETRHPQTAAERQTCDLSNNHQQSHLYIIIWCEGFCLPRTLMTRKTAEEESKAPLYRVIMVERWAPKRFPTWRQIQQYTLCVFIVYFKHIMENMKQTLNIQWYSWFERTYTKQKKTLMIKTWSFKSCFTAEF